MSGPLGFWLIDKIIGRIKFTLFPPPRLPAYSERAVAELPLEGESVSVEMALNSRCNSDFIESQKYGHWGIFDRDTKLSKIQIRQIIVLAQIPRFSDKRVTVHIDGQLLTFVVENLRSSFLMHCVMIESGMQQQLVSVICAALGVGLIFQNLTKNGKHISETAFATTKMLLSPMKPSYGGTYWSSSPPNLWLRGNLPDPDRKGKEHLFSVLKKLNIEYRGQESSTINEVGQLLWAAKGRTPHLYKSKPWGMTIPIWTDKIEATSIYAIMDLKLFKYINWQNGRPTHTIKLVTEVDKSICDCLMNCFPYNKIFIILIANDDYSSTHWEIGYMVMNLILQAVALGISYKATLVSDEIKKMVNLAEIRKASILFAV
jgi:hypothetical protein